MARLTIKGNGFTVDRDITDQQATQILSFIVSTDGGEGGGVSVYPDTPKYSVPILPDNSVGRLSPREYLNDSGATTNVQKVLVLAKYFTINSPESEENFSFKDVEGLFARAKERMPGNLRRDFRMAAELGWIDQAVDSPGRFYVTSTGEGALRAKFVNENGGLKPKKKVSSEGKTKKVKKNLGKSSADLVREEVKQLKLKRSMDGVAKYSDKLSKADKILWILVLAKEKGIEGGLSLSEINHVASKDLIDKRFSNIPTLSKKYRVDAMIESEGGKLYPLHSGIEYIKSLPDE